jgi:cytochrome b involved in lipid metabolism
LNIKYVIYKDRIYDIKHLLDFDHPAGFSLIENNIGNDITKHMMYHSKKAKQLLKKHLIGYLKK